MNKTRPTIIRGGRLAGAGARADLADILIQGDSIAEVGPPGLNAPADAAVVDAANQLMHPGLINAHTHGHGNLAKGMGDRWTLELLLAAGPWITGGRTLEEKYLTTYVGAIEMLLKGCTACYDLTVEFPLPSPEGLDACGRAYADAGMRAVLAPMVAEFSFYQAIPGLLDAMPPELQKEVERLRLAPGEATLTAMRQSMQAWAFDREQVRPAVAPTIPHHCSDDFMRQCAALAREFDVGLHTHVQESKAQVMVGLKRYGKTPTAHLQDLGLLGPDFTVGHGVWLDHDDMQRLGDHGSSVAHNPGSNMRLGNGLADVRGMLARKVNVGIGTDGANCSDNLNMYESMRLASMVSKCQGPDTDQWLTTGEVLSAATEGSARALGFSDRLGRIAPGYKADIVFLDLTNVNWMPFNNVTNQLVHTEDGAAVHAVMVGGRMVVENRQVVGVDMAALARRVEDARARLESVAVPNKQLFESVEQIVNTFCPGLAKMPYHIDRFGGGHHGHTHAAYVARS
ncbi:MAG: 5-methylthioadenosine/S-adenosylhomocysteine deaminase [Alphaproteobacteria bacterium]|nr:5-methylthioadenosine/S-adenosylhomocysteine deaminase [Alphaproteobacteria bacterium]